MKFLGWFLIGWGILTSSAFALFGSYVVWLRGHPPAAGSFEVELLASAGDLFYVVGFLSGVVMWIGGAYLKRSPQGEPFSGS